MGQNGRFVKHWRSGKLSTPFLIRCAECVILGGGGGAAVVDVRRGWALGRLRTNFRLTLRTKVAERGAKRSFAPPLRTVAN